MAKPKVNIETFEDPQRLGVVSTIYQMSVVFSKEHDFSLLDHAQCDPTSLEDCLQSKAKPAIRKSYLLEPTVRS